MINIKLIPAEYGDCVMVSVGDTEQYNLIIDGGLLKTYQKYLKKEISNLTKSKQKINLMICTHMDNDHICGLIHILKNSNTKIIENVWYNGFLQVIDPKYYSKEENQYTSQDNEILDKIISQGMMTDSEQEIGINEGLSFGVLIEHNNIPINTITKGQAICAETVKNKYKLRDGLYITVVGPSEHDIDEVREKWKQDMVARNYMFRVINEIKLTEAFEYQMERVLLSYSNEKTNISEAEDLEKYIGDLSETDESFVNKSSIAFILEYNEKKYLFLGDTVIDDHLMKNIEKEVGFKYHFSAIKLPHHGSRYNITHDFISRYTADEYYCLTNSKKFGHPDLEVLSEIICRNSQYKTIVFNYPIEKALFLDNENWKEKYNYEVVIGDGENVVERVFI